jgi:hypothetical protein
MAGGRGHQDRPTLARLHDDGGPVDHGVEEARVSHAIDQFLGHVMKRDRRLLRHLTTGARQRSRGGERTADAQELAPVQHRRRRGDRVVRIVLAHDLTDDT